MSIWGFLSPLEAQLRDVIARLNEKLPLIEKQVGAAGEPGAPGGSDRLTQPDTTQLLMTNITDGYLLSRDGTDIAGVDPDTVGAVLNLLGTYEAQANGLVGDGATDDRAALNTLANTTIGASGGTIVFKPGTYKISSDLSLPTKANLVFQRGAMLSVDAGVQVTILGQIHAGLYQIFTGSGKKNIRLCVAADAGFVGRRSNTGTLHPEWWGAVANGTTNDWEAMQICHDVAAGYPFFDHTVTDHYTINTVPTGTTLTVSGVTWPTNQHAGVSVTFLTGAAANTTLLVTSSTATQLTFGSAHGASAADTFRFDLSHASSSSRWVRATVHWSPGKYAITKPIRLLNQNGTSITTGGVENTGLSLTGGQTGGTASGGSATTLVDAGIGWTVNEWRHYWVHIHTGTGAGQFYKILTNTTDTLTIEPRGGGETFSPAPDGTSQYYILPETVIDFNGCFLGNVGSYSWEVLAPGAMFGLYYRRHPGYTNRGSSQIKFGIIRGSGPVFRGYQIGGYGYSDNYQEDNPIFDTLRYDGAWDWNYAYYFYDAVAHLGQNANGNNLNHGGSISGVQTKKFISTGSTNFWLRECHSAVHKYGIYFEAMLVAGSAEIVGWRAESMERLVDFEFKQYQNTGSLKIGTLWVPDAVLRYDSTLGFAPWVRWLNGGALDIEHMHVDLSTLYEPQAHYSGETTNSGTTTTITQTGAGWTVDQFKGYIWKGTSGTGQQQKVRIASNTSDTITFESALAIAPDATTVWQAYLVPTIYTPNKGAVTIKHCALAGGDVEYAFRPANAGARISVYDYNDLEPNGSFVRRNYTGLEVHTGFTGNDQQGARFSFLQGYQDKRPSSFIDQIAEATLGFSGAETPYLRVRALGTSPSVTIDKVGSHTGGATTRNYKVILLDGSRRALPSAAVSVTNTLATLTATDYVRIRPTPTPFLPAWRMIVLKDTGGGTYARFVDCPTDGLTLDECYYFTDTGQGTVAYTVPTVDETGFLTVDGYTDTNGLQTATTSKTGAYTATLTDSLILCNATGGAFTVTLPAAAGATGVIYTIKKTDASANAVTVDGSGAETIDGAATQALAAQWDSLTIQCNGTAWFIL